MKNARGRLICANLWPLKAWGLSWQQSACSVASSMQPSLGRMRSSHVGRVRRDEINHSGIYTTFRLIISKRLLLRGFPYCSMVDAGI